MALPHGLRIADGLTAVDFERVHAWLSSSYWTPGITRDRVEHAARHSAMVLSLIDDTAGQVGFLRVVSDKARFAYLCDVWIAESHRGRGLGRLLVRHAMAHPEFATVSTWTLATKDAQSVYAPLGFRDVCEPGAYPNTWMILRKM